MTMERVRIERSYKQPVERVWRMWTTPAGIEKWWGPDGFKTTVQHMDVRAGGTFEMVMSAVGKEQIEFVKKAGVPAENRMLGKYTIVDVNARLAWTQLVDFIPGKEPYDTLTDVTLVSTVNGGTKVVVAIERMHDDHWTNMAKMGWENELGRLEQALEET